MLLKGTGGRLWSACAIRLHTAQGSSEALRIETNISELLLQVVSEASSREDQGQGQGQGQGQEDEVSLKGGIDKDAESSVTSFLDAPIGQCCHNTQ